MAYNPIRWIRKLFLFAIVCFFSCQNNAKQYSEIDSSEVQNQDTTTKRGAFNWYPTTHDNKILLPIYITKYITKGHEPIDTFSADLNEDGINDFVIVTAAINEDTLPRFRANTPRQLLVFQGRKGNSPQFLFKNPKAIPCGNCCGMTDPYAGLSVSKGRLVINEYCASNWKNLSEYRFRYNPAFNDMLLDTIISETYSFDFENYNLDTMTENEVGRTSIRDFAIEPITDLK